MSSRLVRVRRFLLVLVQEMHVMAAGEELARLQRVLGSTDVSLWEWLVLNAGCYWTEQHTSIAYFIDRNTRFEEGWCTPQLFLPHANLQVLEAAETATWTKEWVACLSLSQAHEILAERADFKDPDIEINELIRLRILTQEGFRRWTEISLKLNEGGFCQWSDDLPDKVVYHSAVPFSLTSCCGFIQKDRPSGSMVEGVEVGPWAIPGQYVMPAGWRSIVYNP